LRYEEEGGREEGGREEGERKEGGREEGKQIGKQNQRYGTERTSRIGLVTPFHKYFVRPVGMTN
jgi:hypothetical protein